MSPHLEARVAYGRSIRDRALCLLDAHGHAAEAQAREAAGERGSPAAEQCYWSAVAARIARLSAARPMTET